MIQKKIILLGFAYLISLLGYSQNAAELNPIGACLTYNENGIQCIEITFDPQSPNAGPAYLLEVHTSSGSFGPFPLDTATYLANGSYIYEIGNVITLLPQCYSITVYFYNWAANPAPSISPMANYEACPCQPYEPMEFNCRQFQIISLNTMFYINTAPLTYHFCQSFIPNNMPYPSSILWDFGDGNTSSQWCPTHTFASPGIYIVCHTFQFSQIESCTMCTKICVAANNDPESEF